MRRVARLLLASSVLAAASPVTASAAVDPAGAVQWALDAIRLDHTPAGTGAQGVTVAILDTGVALDHPALAGRVTPGPDFVDGGLVGGDPHGHGTHIAGLVAGIASGARIYAVRILDADNRGTSTDLARGIDAAVAAGVDVINISLNWPEPAGSGGAGPLVDAALRRATEARIAVVAAAGNNSLDSCEEPAQPDYTLCVGALDERLRLAPFSSHGRGLGVVAPGVRIVSTAPGGGSRRLSGTSQAAAVGSGVAALLAGQGLRGKEILDRLRASARDLGVRGEDATYGAGLVDAERALDGASEGRLLPPLRLTHIRRIRADTVRSRGLRVTCDAARAGTCTIKIRAEGITIATGRAWTDGAAPIPVIARVTRSGKRLLRDRPRLKATVSGGLPGAPGARSAVTLR